jgi:ABC-2 type transport system permease protein
MRNEWLVIRHEARVVLGSRWFWTMTIAFPLLLVALTALPEAASRRAFRVEALGLLEAPTGAASVIGYVDPAGLIAALPPGFEDRLRAYPDEETARAALAAGDSREYYVIPADYLATGRIVLVAESISPLVDLAGAPLLEQALTYNLVGDAATAALIQQPIRRLEERPLRPDAPRREQPEDLMSSLALPFGVMFILFFILTASAGFMLQSVSKEKQSRTAEVLLVSLRPRELMLGKLIGLGFVALVQMAFWLGGDCCSGAGGSSSRPRARSR